ncbi:Small subunit (SSU) processome component [Tulasnella sp. 403]|nr:Small subunit (SSU) processome component [Tulasnella sp. 403]
MEAGSSRNRSDPSSSRTNNDDEPVDGVVASLAPNTALPRKQAKFGKTREPIRVDRTNKFVRAPFQRKLAAESRWQEDTKEAVLDAEILKTNDGGQLVPEGPLERTWKVTQSEVVKNIGEEQSKYRREWKLDGGPYRSRYTRNGRHLVVAGKKGHVASFDWQAGKLHCELQLMEMCRDITYLNDQAHFAVAQKRHVYVYDQQGIELHRLSDHIEPTRLEYLPYHWLLATIGNPGILRYHDMSTGKQVAGHKTRLGASHAMAQNLHNAVIYLGHQKGTVTLWTPNLDEPAVKLLAHLGGVTSISIDPSTQGRYMATSGIDGKVKVWDCRNWKGCLKEWESRGTGHAELEWSQKGFLGVASSGSINVYSPKNILDDRKGHPTLYMTHPIPMRPLTSVRFCPFTDVLTVGHAAGLSSIIVPGAGEPTFDSSEADPFESKHKRREREVKNLLDKASFSSVDSRLITLDPELVGTVAPPEQDDEFAEVKQKPDWQLTRQERIWKAGLDAPLAYQQSKANDEEDMELGYSASDSSDSEYDAHDDAPAGDDTLSQSQSRTLRKRKKSALKVYQKRTGVNIIDPTVMKIKAKMAARRQELAAARKAQLKKSEEASGSSALERFKQRR